MSQPLAARAPLAPLADDVGRLDPEPGTPLYVHLPFCVVKCTYCDFFSVVDEGDQDLDGTLDALLREAEARAPQRPATVFFGGGTPSYYAVPQLERLFGRLDELTGFRASAREVTLEANPESLDAEKAQALAELGVTRLSIGFQSLRPEILELFGRAHDRDQSFAAFAAARAAGIPAVNVDVIHGVPGQRLAAWQADLDEILALGPDHVSAYQLAFEEGTPFTRWLERGRIDRLPEETELGFLHATRARLAEAGYEPYEISNFARNGLYCHHNINYWRNGPYVGLGPSAASKIGHTRFGNPRSLRRWRERVEAARPAAEWSETLDAGARLGETWWLGLRLAAGVSPAEARRAAGVPLDPCDHGDPAEACAVELARDGWLEQVAGRWRLTERGLPLADSIAARFLAVPAHGEARDVSARKAPTAAG